MRPSASRLTLLDACAWWAREDVQAPAEPPNEYMDRGNAFHALVESGGDVSREEFASLSPEDAAIVLNWWEAWIASEWAKVPWRHEVAFAYDPATDTARELTTGGHRDYSLAQPGELVGTADLVHVDRTAGLVWVPDIKTGAQRDLAPIAEHQQLRFLALAAARANGLDAARIVLLPVDDDGVRPEAHDLDAFDLADEAAKASARMARIPTARPTPGGHCTRCPAVTVCPEAAERQEALAAVEPVALTDDMLPDVLAGLAVAEKRIDALRAWAKARTKELGKVALPDGRVARVARQESEFIRTSGPSGAEAQDVLARHGVGGAVKVSVSASWEAIEDTLKAAGMKGREGKAQREAKLAAIRAELSRIGALTTTESEVLRLGKGE